jgi:hypothetical protein
MKEKINKSEAAKMLGTLGGKSRAQKYTTEDFKRWGRMGGNKTAAKKIKKTITHK